MMLKCKVLYHVWLGLFLIESKAQDKTWSFRLKFQCVKYIMKKLEIY